MLALLPRRGAVRRARLLLPTKSENCPHSFHSPFFDFFLD